VGRNAHHGFVGLPHPHVRRTHYKLKEEREERTKKKRNKEKRKGEEKEKSVE